MRIHGVTESRVSGVTLDNVAMTFDRWTSYPGAVYDNRPTTAYSDIEKHSTPGISIRYADNIVLKDCRVAWGQNRPEYFTHALEAENTTNLALTRFAGDAAHPERDPSILIR